MFSVPQHSQSQKHQQQPHGGPPQHKPHVQQISLEKLNDRGYHLEKQQQQQSQQSSHMENMYRIPMSSIQSGMLTISPQSQQVCEFYKL